MKKIFCFYLLMALLMCSCTILDDLGITGPVEIESVTMTAHDFQLDGAATRTAIEFSEQGPKFIWTSNDVVGVFPNQEEATQVKFPIADGNVEGGTATSSANFSGKGWAVMKANTYAAYYPFVSDMDLNMESIPLDYTGQKQKGNNNADHVSKHDHMVAKPTEPTSDGEIAFDFQHLGSLFQFVIPVPKKGTYKTLTLKCEDAEFVTEGHVDITSDDPHIIADKCDNCFTIELDNVQTTREGESLIINVLLPPVDMRGHKITVRLQGPNADFETSFTPKNAFQPGTAYRPNLPAVEGGDIVKLMNGKDFNRTIKSFVNNEDFLYEKPDYKINKIAFEVNNTAEPTLPYVRVDDPASPQPIYAMWDASTKTLTMRSSAPKIYANEDATGMFNELEGLTNFSATSFYTTFATRISEMFKSCVSLQNLDLSLFETQNVVEMRNLFDGCRSLTELNTTGFDTSNTTDMSEMFKGCEKFSTIDVSHLNLTALVRMPGMFSGCSNVKNIVFNQSNHNNTLRDISSAFSGCPLLTNIDISWINTSNINEFSFCFDNCSNLKTITGNLKVTSAASGVIRMFGGCRSLLSLDVSEWDVSNISDYNGVFDNCSSLKVLDVSKWNTSNSRGFAGTFAGCSSLTSLDVSNWNTSYVTNCYRTFADCSSLTTLDVSKWNTSKVQDFSGMFGGLTLKSLDVSNFNTGEGLDFSRMFERCHSLTSIDLSRWSMPKAQDLSFMFVECSSLSTADLSNLKPRNCIRFNYMFRDCTKLQSVNLDNFVTSSANYMEGMFYNCSNLTSLNLNSFETSHVIDMSWLFAGCSKLKQVNWGSGFDTHYCTTMNHMFSGSGFETLDLSHFNTSSLVDIGFMFEVMPNLTSLNISSFNTSHVENSNQLFYDCYKLSDLNLGATFRMGANKNAAFGEMGRNANGAKTIRCSEAFMNNDADSYVKANYNFINASTGEAMTPASRNQVRRKK